MPGSPYNPYPQQQQVYQQPSAIQPSEQAQTPGATQPPVNQAMYPQYQQQQAYTSGAQQVQVPPRPQGPPIGPPQAMATGTNPYGMTQRGQGPSGPNAAFYRYPQAPAYR